MCEGRLLCSSERDYYVAVLLLRRSVNGIIHFFVQFCKIKKERSTSSGIVTTYFHCKVDLLQDIAILHTMRAFLTLKALKTATAVVQISHYRNKNA